METSGGSIPIELEYHASKEVIVSFSTAVAGENNRGSITNAQRAGRATAGSGSRVTAGSGSRSKPAIASGGGTRQQPIRRLRQQLDPLPDRQLEPVKKTQKRKAVEDVGEVDLGPRKLRSNYIFCTVQSVLISVRHVTKLPFQL